MLQHRQTGKLNCQWCGPSALAAITGLDTSTIAEMICSKRKDSKRLQKIRETNPSKLSTCWFTELENFLKENGFPNTKFHHTKNNGKLVYHRTEYGGHHEYTNGHPTFTKWLKSCQDGLYIVRVGGSKKGHFLAVGKKGKRVEVCDSAGTKGKVIPHGKGFRYNRSRITSYLEVL